MSDPHEWQTCRCNQCAAMRDVTRAVRIQNRFLTLGRIVAPSAALFCASVAASDLPPADLFICLLLALQVLFCALNLRNSYLLWFENKYVAPPPWVGTPLVTYLDPPN